MRSDAAPPAVIARNTSSRLGRRMETCAPSAAAAGVRSSSSMAARSPCTDAVGRQLAQELAVGVAQFDDVAADARLELVGGALGDDAAAVEHGDAVGEPVGLLEVLRREEDGRAGVGERADDATRAPGGCGCRGRSSARRGRSPARRRRG